MKTLNRPLSVALGAVLASSAALGQEPLPPNLVIDVSGSEPVAAVGGTITYAVTVTNQGIVPAYDLQLYCGLPTGQVRKVDETSPSPSQRVGETEDAEEYLFRLAGLQPGARAEWSLSVEMLAEGEAWIRGVLMAAGLDEPLETWATTQVGSTLPSGPLVLEATATPDEVGVGDTITCEISVTNQFHQPLPNVTVRCVLPEGFLSYVPSEGSQYVEMAGPNQLLFRHPVLNPAERVSFTLVALAEQEGEAPLALWLSGDGLPQPVEQSVYVAIWGEPEPDAENLILVTEDVDPITVDESVVYMVDVENQGTTPLLNLEVLCQLDPERLAYASDYGPSPGEVVAEGQVRFTVPELRPGGRLTWRVTARSFSTGEGWMRADLYSSVGHHGAASQTTRIQP